VPEVALIKALINTKQQKVTTMKMSEMKPIFLFVDIGFIAYWLIVGAHLIPDEYLFKDYNNDILVAWNYSFLPLDMAISITGLSALAMHARNNNSWKVLALISLAFAFCSGLQAIAFWALRKDFDPMWWGPNLFLMLYPLYFFLRAMLRRTDKQAYPQNAIGEKI
jgi:hypothetical protein